MGRYKYHDDWEISYQYDCHFFVKCRSLKDALWIASLIDDNSLITVHADCEHDGVKTTAHVGIRIREARGKSISEIIELFDIQVDEYMRTAEPGVYAIGDVVPTAWLAHVASKEGCVAAEHIAGRDPQPINYDRIPNCTYCEPEIGSVGLSEAKAKERGYDVKVGKFPFSALAKAKILGETEGFVKVVTKAEYDEVLGVHIIGPQATDLLAEACVALGLEATAEELGRIMHAHPTLSEAVMEAAEAVHGMATSI